MDGGWSLRLQGSGPDKGPLTPSSASTLTFSAADPQSQMNLANHRAFRADASAPQPFPPQSETGIFHPKRTKAPQLRVLEPHPAPPYRPAEDRRGNQGQVLVSFSLGRPQGWVQERMPTPLPGAPQASLAVQLLCVNPSLLPSSEWPPDSKGAGAPCIGPESQLCVFQRLGRGFREEGPERVHGVVRATSSLKGGPVWDQQAVLREGWSRQQQHTKQGGSPWKKERSSRGSTRAGRGRRLACLSPKSLWSLHNYFQDRNC